MFVFIFDESYLRTHNRVRIIMGLTVPLTPRPGSTTFLEEKLYTSKDYYWINFVNLVSRRYNRARRLRESTIPYNAQTRNRTGRSRRKPHIPNARSIREYSKILQFSCFECGALPLCHLGNIILLLTFLFESILKLMQLIGICL